MQRFLQAVAFLLAFSALVLSQSSSGAPAQSTTPSVSSPHPKGDYITVNGARLWYESEGSGEALVLIAGGPGISHDYFHPYFSALRDSFRVIYFDAFGRGKSEHAKNPSEYTLARDVEDIEGLRKALNLGKINVLGHSYGGTAAQSYALRFPDSVRRLIVVDRSFSGEMWQANSDISNNEVRNQFPETWEKIRQVREQGFNTCSKEYQEVSDFPPAFLMFYNAANFEKLIDAGGSLNNDVYCAIVGPDADFIVSGEISQLDLRQDLRKLRMPMLIWEGRFDRVVSPSWAVQYKRFASQAQFVMFEKSGHFPFIEETDNAMRVLRDFLLKQ